MKTQLFFFNPFHATDLFWYPLKISVEISSMKWVDSHVYLRHFQMNTLNISHCIISHKARHVYFKNKNKVIS